MQATVATIPEYGFAGLPIQRIADKADLSKSSFYHLFDDKSVRSLKYVSHSLQQYC